MPSLGSMSSIPSRPLPSFIVIGRFSARRRPLFPLTVLFLNHRDCLDQEIDSSVAVAGRLGVQPAMGVEVVQSVELVLAAEFARVSTVTVMPGNRY